MKKIISVILICALLLVQGIALARTNEVVSLGADLNEDQRAQMLRLFGVDEDDVEIITITIEEERSYLQGLVSDNIIGNRSISSAYVNLLDDGEGISVETFNITWVSKEMYANAMVTAGIEDAQVIAAAPFNVSGTAALTGIMKAFEEATGEELSEEAKQIANEEMVTTGELGEDIGQDEAAAIIKEIKERILEEGITDPQEIRSTIIEIAAEFNINLTQDQIDKILSLMERIGQLDLNIDKITEQLDRITGGLDDVRRTIEENQGILQQILDAIQGFFRWVADFFSRG